MKLFCLGQRLQMFLNQLNQKIISFSVSDIDSIIFTLINTINFLSLLDYFTKLYRHFMFF